MQEFELQLREGRLKYRIEPQGAVMTDYHGQASLVEIPDTVAPFNTPVVALTKKLFLSQKRIREIRLPKGLSEIGDWTFAYCDKLRTITMPAGITQMGKGAFKDCKHLTQIFLEPAPEEGEDYSYLLTGAISVLEAEYLFIPLEVGTKEWYEKWDNRMLEQLAKGDTSGFTKLILCGEEDLMANQDVYVVEKRKSKARMCFLRLLHPRELSEKTAQILKDYLCNHTKGCESDEAWQVVVEEHGDEKDYFELFTELNCVTRDNFDAILEDMGDTYPEMKAYLIRYKEENLGYTDFFDGLSLD